ncbi:YcaO-like family protein [Bradyrhizobium sp. JYMT SZCCT0428]|uniref:YcaO-like family protein n=1 Tax=Bradyrhizobium sp. JYMT SZCCT0428 TaxID=2807673 RepID=UPI001BABD5EB|nr:YcaO-like family protein [Bradyrhizobium sp. JYMT SZCCT0428]MBR1153715.1 YcaO-like family protein [Bradyrhizobium sp. JYMT SZCCT0428]
MILRKTHYGGTHRVSLPEDTLAKIEPHLSAMGVTRCADVTDLDRIGIPVFCAIRPQGKMIQVTNGKGLSHIDARVSALMEALEIYHAENFPQTPPRRASLRSMRNGDRAPVLPETLPHYRHEAYFAPEFLIDWSIAEELLTAQEVWLPASSVFFFSSPRLYDVSSNGLASGNELTEATLHALYELIERDAISRLCAGGRIRLDPECCIDLDTLVEGPVSDLISTLVKADITPKLIWVKSSIQAHTFWAVLLDKMPLAHCSTVNIGYGTHLCPEVAAIRAITEAAQSRLTYIHGAREDLHEQSYSSDRAQASLFAVFDRLKGTAAWGSFTDRSSDDLREDYRYVVGSLAEAGYRRMYRVDLTRPPFQIPVVKVLVPGLEFNERLF